MITITSNAGILNACLELIQEDRVADLSFELVAQKAQIEIREVREAFPTLNEMTSTLASRSIKKLSEEANQLANQLGLNPLQKLLSNDIEFFYRIETDKKRLSEEALPNHLGALVQFKQYFSIEMPKVYERFFKNNPKILPIASISPAYFGHFISHSLQFFNFKTLEEYEPTSEGRKEITEQILASLFGRDNMELSKFD